MTNREWLEAMDNEQIAEFCYHIFKYFVPAADKYKATIISVLMNWLKATRNGMEALSDGQLATELAQILCIIRFFNDYDRKSRDDESFFESADHRSFIEDRTIWITAWLEVDRECIWSEHVLELVGFETESTSALANDR